MSDRETRRREAEATVEALQPGRYRGPDGVMVDISAALADMCASASLHDLAELADAAAAPKRDSAIPSGCAVSVANETTLAGAEALSEGGAARVCCLVFASAKNPGGGFLRGSEAQEESLARATGLSAGLAMQPAFYERNRSCGTALYTDLAIYLRGVPVLREGNGRFLSKPWLLSMIVAPAPNTGAVAQNEPQRMRDVAPAFERRINGVLELARRMGERRLVLGAWGCGVFGGDPHRVAGQFAGALADEAYAGAFDAVRFSVLDKPGGETIKAFAERFT